VKFRTTLLQAGKTATGVRVPDDVMAELGSGKRPPVRVTINGYTYRSSIATVSGQFMIGVSEEVRRHAGVAGGNEVDVDVELDTQPREVTVPPDFSVALDGDPVARQRFEALSYSNKQRYVLAIEAAKAPETRRRRIEKTVAELRDTAKG
jgi:hypothetical protein